MVEAPSREQVAVSLDTLVGKELGIVGPGDPDPGVLGIYVQVYPFGQWEDCAEVD